MKSRYSHINKNLLSDIRELIRKSPRNAEELSDFFGLPEEWIQEALSKLAKENQIWYDLAIQKWDFGVDKNPYRVKADTESDIGV